MKTKTKKKTESESESESKFCLRLQVRPHPLARRRDSAAVLHPRRVQVLRPPPCLRRVHRRGRGRPRQPPRQVRLGPQHESRRGGAPARLLQV